MLFGKSFNDEFKPNVTFDKAGLLAMANAGPNTNGSQFFIVQGKDAKFLDGDYSVFGQVMSGQEIVDTLAKLPVDRNDRPFTPPKIISIVLRLSAIYFLLFDLRA